MPTAIQRTPPYQQIAGQIRDAIHAGTLRLPETGAVHPLARGDQLPPVRELAEGFGVSVATASRAVSQLQAEHAVWSSNQGTFVSGDDVITRTPTGRLRGPLSRRLGQGETVTVDEVGIVPVPDYVAALLCTDPGRLVVRRQEVTWRHGRPVMLSVDWIPADNKMLAAEALSRAPLPAGVAHLIATVTGRPVRRAEEHLRAREADRREAAALDLPVGSPVLAGVSVWGDDEGPLVYAEWVLPPDQVVNYVMDVEPEEGGSDR